MNVWIFFLSRPNSCTLSTTDYMMSYARAQELCRINKFKGLGSRAIVQRAVVAHALSQNKRFSFFTQRSQSRKWTVSKHCLLYVCWAEMALLTIRMNENKRNLFLSGQYTTITNLILKAWITSQCDHSLIYRQYWRLITPKDEAGSVKQLFREGLWFS